MIHCTKWICCSDSLFLREVDIFKLLFVANNYNAHFFGKILRKFFTLSSPDTEEYENSDECETCFFKASYIGPASKLFTKILSEFVYCAFVLK